MQKITEQMVDCPERRFRGKTRIPALTGVLATTTIFALLYNPGHAVAATAPLTNAKLTWNRSTSSEVVGYRIYYGVASGNYTNSVVVGNVTNHTISNLVNGVTYFFASKAYIANGNESSFSNEALFVPGGAATVQILQLRMAPNKQAILTLNGQSGHKYEIQSSVNLTSWTVLGSVTVGTSGTATYTDTSAPSYSKRYYRTRDITP